MRYVIGCDIGSQSAKAVLMSFSGAVHRLGCNQKLDIIQCVTFGWVHSAKSSALWQMRKS